MMGLLMKSVLSHKWLVELSRLSKWFLHADSDGMIFGLMVNVFWHLNAGGPLQLCLARFFEENFPLGKNDKRCSKMTPE